jgi:sulfite oxidase
MATPTRQQSAKSPDFEVLQEEPYNGQPPVAQLLEGRVTPISSFFVRNHAPLPEIDPEELRLEIGGMVHRPLRLRLVDLKNNFGTVEQTATLQCAGNRRTELIAVKEIPGEVPWGASAIGNAVWRGVALAELLESVGVLDGAAHVAFTGLDLIEKHGERFGFGGSIPLAKALDPAVLLAWEMNGEPLPPEHGYPLRVVVPGYIGARSVKWVARIEVQAEPSDNYYQRRSYRLFPAEVGPDGAPWERGLELGELSLSSVICSPADGAEVVAGEVEVRGWAMAGGDRTIHRVEVSADHGATWAIAEHRPAPAGVWCHWRARLPLAEGSHELICRAWDSSANCQPEDPAQLWNFKGYMNNAWHRVRVWCQGGQERDAGS